MAITSAIEHLAKNVNGDFAAKALTPMLIETDLVPVRSVFL